MNWTKFIIKTAVKNANNMLEAQKAKSMNENQHDPNEKHTQAFFYFPVAMIPEHTEGKGNKLASVILGIILNMIFWLIPLINIFTIFQVFNLLFVKVYQNTIPKKEKQTFTKKDLRHKGGYKIIGQREVTTYELDKTQPYLPLSEKQIRLNKLNSIPIFIFGTLITIPLFIIYLPSVLIAFLFSFFYAKSVNKHYKPI